MNVVLAIVILMVSFRVLFAVFSVDEQFYVAVEASLFAAMSAFLFADKAYTIAVLSALLCISNAYTYRRLVSKVENKHG